MRVTNAREALTGLREPVWPSGKVRRHAWQVDDVGYYVRFPASAALCLQKVNDNKNNNMLCSSRWEIKAVVRSHNEEHTSVILSRETYAHTHS